MYVEDGKRIFAFLQTARRQNHGDEMNAGILEKGK
jgi:hypothetical protein